MARSRSATARPAPTNTGPRVGFQVAEEAVIRPRRGRLGAIGPDDVGIGAWGLAGGICKWPRAVVIDGVADGRVRLGGAIGPTLVVEARPWRTTRPGVAASRPAEVQS